MPSAPHPVMAAFLAAALSLVGQATAASSHATPAEFSTSEMRSTPERASTLEASVVFRGCSGSLVRFTSSLPSDPAMVMTNGHCMSPAPRVGEVRVNRSSRVKATLLAAEGRKAMDLTTSTLLYGTMAGTDVALYTTTATYQAIMDRTSIQPYVIAAQPPTVGDRVYVPSALWKTIYECSLDKIVYKLKEAGHVWPGAVRYAKDTTGTCTLKSGTSGSPIVNHATSEIIAINNTGDDGGPLCGDMGPCEEDEQGTITRGIKEGYGTRLEGLYTCLTPTRTVDVNVPGCTLAKPRR